MKIGFTGTRRGMTQAQLEVVRRILGAQDRYCELHHGDCIGADDQADEIAIEFDMYVIVHPPVSDALRACCFWKRGRERINHIERGPKPYHERNRAIVDETDFLIAAPASLATGGGTWYTINYALEVGKNVYAVMPDGTEWDNELLESHFISKGVTK